MLVAAANLAAAGCARSWPTVRPQTDAAFQAGAVAVERVDILPLNVEVAAWEGSEIPPDELAASFDLTASTLVTTALVRRGYQVGAVIDWSGQYDLPSGERGVAFTAEEVAATADSLTAYGIAQAQRPTRRLAPILPVRLGVASGSDATLYVGGYAYSGKDGGGISAGDVAKGIFIAAFIVVVVAVAVIGLKHGGGSAGGATGRAVANAGGAAGRVVAHGSGHVARGLGYAVRGAGRATVRTLDVMAQSGVDTHIEIYADEAARPRLPEKGPSQMLLDMTLVDNRTGQPLWHAQQKFRANPGRPGDVAEVMARMLGTLPAR